MKFWQNIMTLMMYLYYSFDDVQSQCYYFEQGTCNWSTNEWKESKDCVPDASKTPQFKKDGNFISLENQNGNSYSSEFSANSTTVFPFQYYYYSDQAGGNYMMTIYFYTNESETDFPLLEMIHASTNPSEWRTASINCSQHQKYCKNETCQDQILFIIIDNFEVQDQCDASEKPAPTLLTSNLCNEAPTQLLPTKSSDSKSDITFILVCVMLTIEAVTLIIVIVKCIYNICKNSPKDKTLTKHSF